jgi:hypothetical protein
LAVCSFLNVVNQPADNQRGLLLWGYRFLAGGTDFFAETFDKRVRDALHRYTHSGTMQVARRFDGNKISPSHKPNERADVVRMTTLAFAMSTVIITASLDFHPERTRANEICAEYTTKPSGT